jgi:hypothetical protein
MNKPLIINTHNGYAEGTVAAWNEMQNMQNFIKDIATPHVDNNTFEQDLNQIISGIPTPWARATIFKYAIEYMPDAGNTQTPQGLMAFYKNLQDEWKGIIACMVLDKTPITVEKISLEYENRNSLFEVRGALGNMLFESRYLWCDREDFEKNPQSPPTIQIIKYQDVVIGATSPYSLLFAAPQYDIKPNKSVAPFYRNGKFTNPLPYLDAESVQKLFVYVQHIKDQITTFAESLDIKNKRKHDLSLVKNFMANWEKDIRNYAQQKNFALNESGLVDSIEKFAKPFDKLFNIQTKIYGYQGRFYTKKDNEKATEVNLNDLLLPSADTHLAEIRFASDESPDRCAVHLLEASSEQGKMYFALPLSSTGVLHFEDTLHLLLGKEKDTTYRNSLTALYEHDKKQVKITLSLEVDHGGNNVTIETIYSTPRHQDYIIHAKRIIAFPDFVSEHWQSYFLYSELPHNTADALKTFPILADYNFKLLTQQVEKANLLETKLIYATDETVNLPDFKKSSLPVQYNYDKLGVTSLKYEIFSAAYPFKGIELRLVSTGLQDKVAGYFIAKDIRMGDKYGLTKLQPSSLQPVKVGFDFGSNNTCISFAKNLTEPTLVEIKNRRRFFLGNDVEDKSKKRPAESHELFFFPNEERKGQLKSMILIHDEKRLKNPNVDISNAISGGFPVFEPNIPVDTPATATTYTVRLGSNTAAEIKYNMKWSHIKKENDYKTALLKTLWLMVNAELFATQQAYPEHLLWAYPSAMSENLQINYQILWQEVAKLNVIKHNYSQVSVAQVNSFGNGQAALTESEAVCRFALSRLGGMAPATDTLFIGYDVGGSTTDILMVLKVKEADGNYKTKMIKQSSVLAAAGKLAEAVKKSRKIQDGIKQFADKFKEEVGFMYGIEKMSDKPELSSFYLNVLFDRLNEEQLKMFYNEFYQNNNKEIFAITAYISGLLLFYSGQLTAKVLENHPEITTVQQGFYGKGGRIFDWLPAVMQGVGVQFYQDCFKAGMGEKGATIRIANSTNNSQQYNKSEVALGLCSAQDFGIEKTNHIPEVIGENGYTYNGNPLTSLNEILPQHLASFDGDFRTPIKFEELGKFIAIYCNFCDKYQLANSRQIKDTASALSLLFRNYVATHPEYIAAMATQQQSGNFEFKSPMIILEGMCLFENVF